RAAGRRQRGERCGADAEHAEHRRAAIATAVHPGAFGDARRHDATARADSAATGCALAARPWPADRRDRWRHAGIGPARRTTWRGRRTGPSSARCVQRVARPRRARDQAEDEDASGEDGEYPEVENPLV